NNNPGNLKYFGQSGSKPEHPWDGKGPRPFAVFDTMADGWAALFRQLQLYVSRHPDYTILNIMALYLGNKDPLHPEVTKEGDPFSYAKAVANAVGVSPNQGTLAQIFATNGACPMSDSSNATNRVGSASGSSK